MRGSKRYKTSESCSFNKKDKAKDAAKKKGSRATRSSSMNDEALVRLIVFEMASQNERAIEIQKEERLSFLEIKRREVECREREIANRELRQRHEDISFYLQSYDHLVGDARTAMESLRAEIKANNSLPY
ncbi:hypothetical protein Tco_1360910 [Tanacetum coccineum]